MLRSCRGYLTNRSISDASRRIVDDSFEGLLIIGVGHQTEIGDHIRDLLTLVEAQSSIYSIRYIGFAHRLLKTTALSVCPIENGKVGVITVVLTFDPMDVLTDDSRFLTVAIGLFEEQFLPYLFLTVHILVYLSYILLDQTVGSHDDILCTTVVLLQFEEFCICK